MKINKPVTLSCREKQCLELSVRGKSARLAALELGLSQRTVEEYLNKVKSKLGVRSKGEMIELWLRMKLGATQD